MRVAIFGSLRKVAEAKHSAFESTCVDLGFELAKRAYLPLLHSEAKKSADRYIINGLKKYAIDSGNKPRVEIHRAIDAPKIYTHETTLQIKEIHYSRAEESADKRLGSRVGTIARSDIVFLIGGSSGTRKNGAYALDLKKPILAIPFFGGSAEKHYLKLEPCYMQNERIADKLSEILKPIHVYPAASDLVDLCELLSGIHSYFVSYAHKDSMSADHIEVLLLRSNKNVRRDERKLEFSEPIKSTLKEQIAKSDTFICLWSKNSVDSKWCKWECETALGLNRKVGRPRRVVLILLDQTELTRPWSDFIQLRGESRHERELAVRRLTESEVAV